MSIVHKCPACGFGHTLGTLCAMCELKKLQAETDVRSAEHLKNLKAQYGREWPPERVKAQVGRTVTFSDDELFELYVNCRTINGTSMFQGFDDQLFFKTVFKWFQHMLTCVECEMCTRGHVRQIDVHLRKKLKPAMLSAVVRHLEKQGAPPALIKSLDEIPDRDLLGYAPTGGATS